MTMNAESKATIDDRTTISAARLACMEAEQDLCPKTRNEIYFVQKFWYTILNHPCQAKTTFLVGPAQTVMSLDRVASPDRP